MPETQCSRVHRVYLVEEIWQHRDSPTVTGTYVGGTQQHYVETGLLTSDDFLLNGVFRP
jgi:hypothetical protein